MTLRDLAHNIEVAKAAWPRVPKHYFHELMEARLVKEMRQRGAKVDDLAIYHGRVLEAAENGGESLVELKRMGESYRQGIKPERLDSVGANEVGTEIVYLRCDKGGERVITINKLNGN